MTQPRSRAAPPVTTGAINQAAPSGATMTLAPDNREFFVNANAQHETAVTTLRSTCSALVPALRRMLDAFGMTLNLVPAEQPIPGSFWGEPEAGLIGADLYVRTDTPVHSALHEACHYICMSARRRGELHTDAGGSPLEECGVCYLSILLADLLPGFGRARMLTDMDCWGYSFRLGSAAVWFDTDAEDARQWLRAHGLIDADRQITWKVREGSSQLKP